MSKSFEKSKAKQDCRNKLAEISKLNLLKCNTIVTLPSRLSLCVKTFKKAFRKANIIGIERDAEIFNEICNQGIYCVNADIRQWVHSQTIPASHVDLFFMDYYSYLHEGIVGDLKAFLNNANILHNNKKCILGLTLSKGMRVGKEQTLEFIKEYVFDEQAENTLDTIAKALKSIISNNDREPQEIKCIYKKEYRTGQQMYFFVFEIVM